MCAVAVVVGSVLALLAIAALARWAAARRVERVRREEVRAAQLVGAADAEQEPKDRYHDAERGGRRFVTVDEVIERVAAEQASAAQRSRRPAPRTIGAAEDTDQLSAFALRPPSPYPRSGRR